MDEDLIARVVGLERRTRRLTGCIIVVIMFLIAILLVGVVELNSVSNPRRLAIIDREGNEVALLRAYGSLPGLRLLKGPDGWPIPQVGEVKPEPNLRLFDDSGNVVVLLCYDQFGSRLSLRGCVKSLKCTHFWPISYSLG